MCSKSIVVTTLGTTIISDSVAVPIAADETTEVASLPPLCTITMSAVAITTVPLSLASLATNVTAAPDLVVVQLGNSSASI